MNKHLLFLSRYVRDVPTQEVDFWGSDQFCLLNWAAYLEEHTNSSHGKTSYRHVICSRLPTNYVIKCFNPDTLSCWGLRAKYVLLTTWSILPPYLTPYLTSFLLSFSLSPFRIQILNSNKIKNCLYDLVRVPKILSQWPQ